MDNNNNNNNYSRYLFGRCYKAFEIELKKNEN